MKTKEQNVETLILEMKIMTRFGSFCSSNNAFIKKRPLFLEEGDFQKEGFESLACYVKRSQESFKSYYQTDCTWNLYGAMYNYC